MTAKGSVLLTGVGGQGVVLASHIAAAALHRSGSLVKQSEVHGMSQRGGVVSSHLRYGPEVASPLIELGTADAVLAFEWSEAVRALPYLRPGGVLVADAHRILPPGACLDRRSWLAGYPALDPGRLGAGRVDLRLLDATAVAAGLGEPRAANSVLLGVLSTLIGVPLEAWRQSVREGVPARSVEANLKAFAAGRRPLTAKLVGEPAWGAQTPVPAKIEIRRDWCKGCDICIRFCPEHCLVLDSERRVAVTDPTACTGCRLCELLCPDFAIAVTRKVALNA